MNPEIIPGNTLREPNEFNNHKWAYKIIFSAILQDIKGNFLQKYCLWPKEPTFRDPPPPYQPQKWGSILLDYFSQRTCPRYYKTKVLAISWIRSVQNGNLKSAHINVKNIQIAAYEPGSLLLSYSGAEFYHDGYLRSSTIVLWKLANKVVDVELIRREAHVRGRVVWVSEAVRVRFRSLKVPFSGPIRRGDTKYTH